MAGFITNHERAGMRACRLACVPERAIAAEFGRSHTCVRIHVADIPPATRPGRKPALTPGQEAELLAYADDGWSLRFLAGRFGLATVTVTDTLCRLRRARRDAAQESDA